LHGRPSAPAGAQGVPRLFIFSSCRQLIAQLQSAPLALDDIDAGEAVDRKWASAHGHAVDAARYGAMSRPSPPETPELDPALDDPRAEALRQSYLRERELDEARDFETWEDSLYGY